MGRTLHDRLSTVPPERRDRIARRRDEMLAEIDTLQALRKRVGRPQTFLARKLGISQPAVSKLENQTDMTLSALRDYVGAIGGTVDIVIRMPGHAPVRLETLSDLEDAPCEEEPSPRS